MHTQEFIPPNYVFKDYVSKEEHNSADLNRLRFSSLKVAKRYLNKFSPLEKFLANCLLHSKTREYNAALVVLKMSQQSLDRMRNVYFYNCMYTKSGNPFVSKLVLERDWKLYIESSEMLFSIN